MEIKSCLVNLSMNGLKKKFRGKWQLWKWSKVWTVTCEQLAKHGVFSDVLEACSFVPAYSRVSARLFLFLFF